MGKKLSITDAQLAEMQRRRNEGEAMRDIAEDMGVSAYYVQMHTEKGAKQGTAEWRHSAQMRRAAKKFRSAADRLVSNIAAYEAGRRPCEHCQWRRNKEERPVCLCYREAFRRKTKEDK